MRSIAYLSGTLSLSMTDAFIMASPNRALPLKRDAAHIPVNAVAAQAEGDCQLFAAQQFAILHIGALQNIDPVMPAVGFDFCKFEARIAVEHSADHFAENLKEKRTDKRELRHGAQTLSVRLHTDPDGFLHQADGFFLRDVFDHLQIDRSAREDHPFGMQLFLFGKALIFAAQFVAECYRVIDQNIRLLPAKFLSQLT